MSGVARLRRTLARPALLVVCLLSLIGAGEELYLDVDLYRAARRDVALARADVLSSRLESLRPFLPRSGVVGYVSEGMRGASFTSPEAMADYYDTQYDLAPVIVVIGAGRPLVVANFRRSTAVGAGIQIPRDYRVVHDEGDGIMLLKREP